jgi:RHS repeat-associated protein
MTPHLRSFLGNCVRNAEGVLHRVLGPHWKGFTLGLVVLGAGAPAAIFIRPVVLPEQPTVAAAPGDTVVVFGPRQFNGSGGSGTTYIERFTVALVPGRKYELKLVNGTAGGSTNRVTSAVTRLNGFQVIGTADLNTGIASVTKVVAVRQIDTLRVTVVGAAGSFVSASLSSLASSEFVVNGPTNYGIPSGTSKTHSFSFTRPATAGPPFRLYLTNGDTAGALRVTNASVALNGATVVTTAEFTKDIGSLTKTVTLNLSNSVTVTLKGNASKFITVWFTASDTAAPAVTITQPRADSVFRTSPITVTGTIADASPTGVTVNGVQATVTNNTSYSASVPLSTQGNNLLTVIATDAGGRTSQVTRNVIFDSQAPALTVTAPTDNSATRNATVAVTGSFTDATAVTVRTNGTNLTVTGTTFTGNVALALGANVLTTTGTDAGGNATSVVRNVTRDTLAPVLTVSAPSDGATTGSDSITVSGSVTDETGVTVQTNGASLLVTGTTFSGKVALAVGANVLTTTATDAAGNATSVVRNVTRDASPPVLTVLAPIEGAITKLDSITVSGTVTDESAVTVQTNGTPFTVGGDGAFSGKVALAVGANVLTTTATDAGGSATSVIRNVTRDTMPPVLTVSAPAEGATTPDDSITVSGTVTDEIAVTVAANGLNLPVTSGSFSGKVGLVQGSNTITVVATDAATNASSAVRNVTRQSNETPPPDPSTVAPPLDQTVAADLSTSTSFLYTGSNPIQTGVAPGTIVPARVAVLSGRVLDRAGEPLPGVELGVLGHPELGRTLSRADGKFDLAVNAGADLTVTYTKSGFLPGQRLVPTVWQAYEKVDDVALVAADTQVTTINFTQPIEVARASQVQDDDGTRQASAMFRQGTQATMVMADGSTQPLPAASVRITEYTVGATGQQAMPGSLPPASAYTYAANLGVDEATSAGAKEVRFDQPVAFYVGNFLNIPVGARVPLGYYDPALGKWRPEPDGRVIKLLDKVAGRAVLGVASDSTRPATQVELDSLGITTAELDRLGTDAAYATGTSWWRTQHTHFSPFDWNYAWWIAVNAFFPNIEVVPERVDDPTCRAGSVIGCENQTLGEVLPVAGTPFSLRYQSDRTAGYSFGTQLTLPALTRVSQASLTGATRLQRNTVPDHVVRIVYRLRVAGQTISTGPTLGASIPATLINWNGRDWADRNLNGRQKAELIAAFCYPANYATSGGGGGGGGGGFGGSAGAVAYVNSAFRPECIERAQPVWTGFLDIWRNKPLGFGGWSLDVHHAYDPSSGTLYLGNGDKRAAGVLGNTVNHVPSTVGSFCSAINCGIPIFDKSDAGRLAAGPDGSLYISYPNEHKTRRLSRIGDTLTTFADSTDPFGLAFGPDGSLYMAEWTRNRVRRRAPDGTITLVTGTGVAGFSGDGGPAALAQVNRPNDVAVGPDGAVFIAEDNGHRIRRIGPDGIITTYGGTGAGGTPISGARATATPIGNPRTLTVGQDGSVYVGLTNRVVRIGTDGVLTLFAGTTTGTTPATRQALLNVNQLVATKDNALIVGTGPMIFRVSLDGNIETVAGRNNQNRCFVGTQSVFCNPFVDGNLAGQTFLEGVTGVAIGPDGSLLFAESSFTSGKYFIRRVRPAMPGLTFGTMLIAAEDGSEVYQFDAAGRHLFTRNANTGDTLYAFGHDSAGRLVTVRDAHANVTTIERSPTTGVATAVVAPFGQRTTLETDAAGYLSRVLDPAGNAVRLFSRSNGLLDSMVTPRGHAHRFAYDGVGRLISDHDPGGGSQTLTRTKSDTGYTVAVTTEMGRITRYKVERLPSGDERRETVAPTGLTMVTTRQRSGETVRTTPDGTAVTTTAAADPRYGIQVPYLARSVIRLPSGDSSVVTTSRTASVANVNDPVSLRGASETVIVNGRSFLTRDTLLSGTIRTTTTTPEGRQVFSRSDSLGRVLMARTGGLDSVLYRYDSRGRLDRVQSGGLVSTLTYDAAGRIKTATDPQGRTDSLFYDTADRLTRRALPNGREILFAYDSSGNVTSVTPPGRDPHAFAFTPDNLRSGYTPPNVGLTTPATTYAYNADRQLTRVTRPDSATIDIDYDGNTGRPSALSFDRGQLLYGYSPSTGHLTTITAPGGNTLSYTYDGAFPKSVTWAGVVQGSVSAGYNGNLRIDTLAVNGANALSFAYDRDGLLTTAGALGIKRHGQHGLVERDSIGTVKGSWNYSARGMLAGYTAVSGGTTLFQTTYLRDSLDRITQATETVQGSTAVLGYAYDSLGRVKEVRRDGLVSATYEYDANGNRLQLTTPSGSLTGTYDAQDRLSAYGTATYTYGSNGELKTRTDGAITTSYTYDGLGNLTQVTKPDTQITYVIDARSRRIGKRVNGTLVQGFLYQNQLSPVAELDGAQQVVSRFVYGTRANVPDYMIKDGVTYRLISDQLGSVRLVVNTSDGTVAQQIQYDEFGRVTENTQPAFQPFGYAGGLMDVHTGLLRFGARDYDPSMGRWTAKDPFGFAGGYSNLYEYAANDPINLIDPTGREPDPCDEWRKRVTELLEEIPKRIYDLRTDPEGLYEGRYRRELGKNTYQGHQDQLLQKQNELNDLLRKIDRNCGGPGPRPWVRDMVNAPVPVRPDWASPSLLEDFSKALEDVLEDIGRGLSNIPPPPSIPLRIPGLRDQSVGW